MSSKLRKRGEARTLLSVTAALLATVVAHAVLLHGAGEEATRLVIRQTARISLLLFAASFSASSLLLLRPAPITRWMMRNRRYLGLGFALSHFVHLAAILTLARLDSSFEVDTVTKIFGGGAYVIIAAMAATSFDGAVRLLGTRNWQRLHRFGSYYLLVLFANSYLPRAAESPTYLPAAVIIVGVVALRAIAARRPKVRTALA